MWPPRVRSRVAALVATLTALLLPLLAVLHLGRPPARSIGLTTVEAVRGPPEPVSSSTSTSSPSTPSVAPPALLPSSSSALPKLSPSPSERLLVVSTAYCETGTMADGERTYFGAAAAAMPMGSRWRVLTGIFAGTVFTIADRYGWGTQFDIALPGRCGQARAYGRQRIEIEPA